MKQNGLSGLHPEDWDRLNEEIDLVLDDGRPNREQAASLQQDFRAAAEDGNEQAERINAAMAVAGILKAINTRNRQQTGIFADSESGLILNVPVKANVPIRDDAGTSLNLTQATLWYELTWEQFDEWVAGQRRHAASMNFKLRGLIRIQRLHEQFPDSKTPGDACAFAGIDPNALDIGAVA